MRLFPDPSDYGVTDVSNPVESMSQEAPLASNHSDLPVAVLGSGPVGLAAAAHLLERGLRPVIFEMGDSVGHSVSQWGHVRLFSPWSQNLDAAAVRLLEGRGWVEPASEEVPFGHELLSKYLDPLAAVPVMAKALRLSSRVVSVTRRNVDKTKTAGRSAHPFVIRYEEADGTQKELDARAVIDATGSWKSPNPVGSSGVEALGERRAANKVFYGMPDVVGRDRARFQSRKILVIGSGHSAANVLLDLALLQTRYPDTEVHWAIRAATPDRYFGGEDGDALAGRGALGRRLHELVDSGKLVIHTSFRTQSVSSTAGSVTVASVADGVDHELTVDEVIACTGSRPDFSFLTEIRLTINSALESAEALAPLIDPNFHSCGSVRPHGERELRHEEEGFYIAGVKSYGRAPTFLMMTGYEQVRSIVAALAGDQDAADRVELTLPETGVCSSNLFITDSLSPDRLREVEASESCCGPAPLVQLTLPD